MLLPFKSKLANIYMHDEPFNFKCKANRTKRLLSLSNLITFFLFYTELFTSDRCCFIKAIMSYIHTINNRYSYMYMYYRINYAFVA